jgi:hypothetical protein
MNTGDYEVERTPVVSEETNKYCWSIGTKLSLYFGRLLCEAAKLWIVEGDLENDKRRLAS